VQYVRWLSLAVRGDLGSSARTHLDVRETIVAKLPVTLELAALSMLVAIAIGIPAGIISAVRRGRAADHVGSLFALIGLSVPHFWLGLMLILLFAVSLRLLPATGFVPLMADPIENLRHLVLPAIVLGTGVAAVLARQMRSSMLTALNADYVRTARSKGLSERQVVVGHAMRNSLITVVTVAGLQAGALLSGAVVTEQIFVIPGFGQLIVGAVFQRDYPMVQGVVLVATVGYILINWAVDMLYSVLDPRLRLAPTAA